MPLMSDGHETVPHWPEATSRQASSADSKAEEHLLFERFMCWWNRKVRSGRHSVEPERHFAFFKLWDAFGQEECPICYLLRKARGLFLASLWYENVNDVGLRDRLHRSLGFCPEATETSLAMGDDLGMSIVYRALSDDIADRLHRRQCLTPTTSCPAAEHVSTMNRTYVETLATHYVADDLQQLHEKSFGLCLQHIGETLAAMPNEELREKLSRIEEAKFRKLREELESFIAKSDYQKKEPLGAERDAWIRAARKFHRQEPLNTHHS
jgi:Family of unknown function (DUF6062)